MRWAAADPGNCIGDSDGQQIAIQQRRKHGSVGGNLTASLGDDLEEGQAQDGVMVGAVEAADTFRHGQITQVPHQHQTGDRSREPHGANDRAIRARVEPGNLLAQPALGGNTWS
jgi:hypothetical protein